MRLGNWRWWPWGRHRRPPQTSPEPGAPTGPVTEQSASGLTLGEATKLLDDLERRSVQVLAVDVAPDGRVSVRWVGPPETPPA